MPSLTATQASELFRTTPDRFVDVGAGEVAVRTVGTGPDVLLVHGWPVSGATFRHLLPHLVDHVTCHVIDLPSAGSSRFDATTPLSIDRHIQSVRDVVDHLGLDSVALVGQDSGGMIARHAMASDARLRAMGLVNTEPADPGWRFTSFIATGKLPGFATAFGWVSGKRRLRRNKFILGDAFADSSLLDGEFDEFFLGPLHNSALHRDAAVRLLKTFDMKQHVNGLADVHAKIDVPVQLVWGDEDPFFPVDRARAMVNEFPKARIEVVRGAGVFSHEEAPAAVAAALLPAITGEWT